MTKQNLKDATRELSQEAGALLIRTTASRKNADALLNALRGVARAAAGRSSGLETQEKVSKGNDRKGGSV